MSIQIKRANNPGAHMPEKRKKLVYYAIIALLFVLCALWWWLDPRMDNTPATGEQPVSSSRTVEKVNAFFRSENATPEAAVELARSLPFKSREDQDAIYRLYYFAAGRDEPAAYMPYAACLDPARTHCGSIRKDGVEAYKIYEKAVKNGQDGATKALGELEAWLREQASSGNGQARQWLSVISGK